MSTVAIDQLPETILQFGAGNFLRGFADYFVDQANRSGPGVGRIVVVQSTASNRADALNAQGGVYHVAVRGLEGGKIVDRVEEVRSISRSVVADKEWDKVLAVAQSATLRWIISNTTEAGFALVDGEPLGEGAPRSFPAKLVRVLQARFESGGLPLTVIPCELIEGNGAKLLALAQEQARRWNLSEDFMAWMTSSCRWINNLVDRIVTGRPEKNPPAVNDPLLVVVEPFASWVLESSDGVSPFLTHPAITVTKDVRTYQLRKVRILNGAHTALVIKALPLGIATVREAVEHAEVGPWLRRLLVEEIIPTIDTRVEGAKEFAEETLVRFANPFVEHQLSSIALNHEAKVGTRLRPTLEEYVQRYGQQPPLLGALLVKTAS